MSQFQPDWKFANLHPSRKLPGLTPNEPPSPELKITPLTARSMILAELLPQVRVEAINWRDHLMAREFWNTPHWESRWLLIPEAQEWSDQDWWVKQKDLGSNQEWQSLLTDELLMVPLGNGPELDQWLVASYKERVFPAGWVRDLFYLDGRLMYEQAILRQAEIRQKEGSRRVEEARGAATWIMDQVHELLSGAGVYRRWEMDELQALEGRWPGWLDLRQIWIGCDSDSMGDRMVLLQGPKEQIKEATRDVVMAQRVNGLEVGVRLNAWFEQLSPMQTVLLMPSALEKGLMLRLL